MHDMGAFGRLCRLELFIVQRFLAFRYHQQVHIACSGTCQSIDHLDHLIHMHVHVLYASVGIDWPELFSINVVHIQL